ncbi:MAG: MBL fold metallo-hydrolase [Campylobacteraceae bacterium]
MNILKIIAVLFLLFAVVLTIAIFAFFNQESFGKIPSGERLKKIEASPNYKDGVFHNRLPSVMAISNKSKIQGLYDFIFNNNAADLYPKLSLPSVKTDLKALKKDENVLVWLGHSSLFLQVDGVKYLVDPILFFASPTSLLNKPFAGTNIYTPEDIPDVDYLLITHDHWDHLDYKAVKKLKNKIGKVVTGLGVGEHFEYWGYDKDKIIELDWNEKVVLDENLTLHVFPARHFSGRGLNNRDKSLWVSFMIESKTKNIFLSGDTGYDIHFKEIAKQFPKIDFAAIENGQYDVDWSSIHLLPQELISAAKELNASRFMTIHNSKYALAKHSWYAPLDNVYKASKEENLGLVTPMIGEVVYLDNKTKEFENWWRDLE